MGEIISKISFLYGTVILVCFTRTSDPDSPHSRSVRRWLQKVISLTSSNHLPYSIQASHLQVPSETSE